MLSVLKRRVLLFFDNLFLKITVTLKIAFLVNAEGVPIDWIAPSIPKLNAEKHREALTNILLLLRRMGLFFPQL